MSRNLSELMGKSGLEKNLFEQIGRKAKDTGTPDVAEMERLAEEFLIGKANVFGTASFYDFTRQANEGKKIYVCNGSSCLTAGTQPEVIEKLKGHFKEEEIGDMCCLGRCHENSAFHYAGHNYSGDAIDRLDEIKNSPVMMMDDYRTGNIGTQVLTGDPMSVNNYREILGNCLHTGQDALLNELKVSGLRGRGGAGFPISIKLDTCRKAEGKSKFIVCNADEGDPGAYSDRYLLEKQPMRVLLGIMVAGFIIGADWGVVYIRGEYPESVDSIESAIEQLNQAGLVGENILGSGFNFKFKVVRGMGAYICGEETALLNSIEGQRPEVRTRPPFPAVHGLFNRPTIVNNVETLACIPWIMKNGGEAYAAMGVGRSTGTKLVSLDGHFNRPGIYEVEMGTPLKDVIQELGGGFNSEIKALHIGGPLGGLVPMHKIDDLTMDFESFSTNGFLLGHASIICLPVDFSVMEYLQHLFEFTADESCGKCFPCRLGSKRGAELIEKARNHEYKIDRQLFRDLIETMEIGSLCALGGGVPLPMRNALMYFDDELKAYFKEEVAG